MKNIIRISSYILLAAFFSVALSGCGKKQVVDPNANKLVVWSFEDEDAWKDIKKSFESENKGVTILYKKEVLDSGYENRVLNSILSGQGPDLWAMPNDWLLRHVDKLAPMPTKDKMFEKFSIDSFLPVVKENVVIDDQIYALSPSAEPLLIYYNPKLIDSVRDELLEKEKDGDKKKRINNLLGEGPPSLWSDLVEASNLLTMKDGSNIVRSGLAAGTSRITYANDILYLLMLQNKTNIISFGEKVATFNLPKDISTGTDDIPGKRAIDFYTSFADPVSPNYSWSDSLGTDLEAFSQGKVAMIFGFSSLQDTLLQKYPTINYKRTYAPQIIGDSGKMVDYARFNAFGVSKLSRNPTAAWLLNTRISKEYSNDLNSYSRLYSSAKPSDSDNYTLKERSGSNPEKLSLIISETVSKGRYPEEFDQNLLDAITLINEKKQDSQSALDLAASKSTELLRREGW